MSNKMYLIAAYALIFYNTRRCVALVSGVTQPKPFRRYLGDYPAPSAGTSSVFARQEPVSLLWLHGERSAQLLSPDTVELTSKRNGEVVAIKRMSVMPSGKSIHVVFKNKEGNTTMTFEMQKER
jgi:hypothetical protein